MHLPAIYFYIPQCYWPQTMPKSADDNWNGFGVGIYAWTVQTYLHLKADGMPCKLVSELPAEGIVLMHRNCLRAHNNFMPGPKLLLICLKAELKSYVYAQVHIVQNPLEALLVKNSYYLPHWPQPGLIPRDPLRGDRFENIAFFGHSDNLAAELLHPSWQKQLNALGLKWLPVINSNSWDDYSTIDNSWNDYSQIDAIVAVRSFDRQTLALTGNYVAKPATKLHNAWLAGVPAVLGCESAYQAERSNEVDYLEVISFTELISTLKRLRDDPILRRAIVKNGRTRAEAIQPSQITAKWRNFLENTGVLMYENWCRKPRWLQQIILRRSYLISKKNRMRHKISFWKPTF